MNYDTLADIMRGLTILLLVCAIIAVFTYMGVKVIEHVPEAMGWIQECFYQK